MLGKLTPLWHQLKPVVRDLGTELLLASGALRPDRRGRDRLTIMTFHRVLPPALRVMYPLPELAVTPDELDGLLGFVREHYTCGPLADLFARWQRGDTVDKPFLAITFDDTAWDNLAHAAPVLRKHDLLATFFAPAGLVDGGQALWHDRLAFAVAHLGRIRGTRFVADTFGEASAASASPEAAARIVVSASKRLPVERHIARVLEAESLAPDALPDWARVMNWDDLRAMADAGHEIGSHSLSHPILPRCSDAQIDQEIVGSRTLIEEKLNRPVQTFCYPNGDFDDRALVAIDRAGYLCAVTTQIGLNGRGDDPRRLRRIDMRARHFSRSGADVCRGRAAWRLSGLASDQPLRLW